MKQKHAREAEKGVKHKKGKQVMLMERMKEKPTSEIVPSAHTTETRTAPGNHLERLIQTMTNPESQDHPAIDPMLSGIGPSHAVGQVTSENNTVIVDETVMRAIINAGHHTIEPFNGPQDGPPLYRIEASALDLLRKEPSVAVGSDAVGSREGPRLTTNPPLSMRLRSRGDPVIPQTEKNRRGGRKRRQG